MAKTKTTAKPRTHTAKKPAGRRLIGLRARLSYLVFMPLAALWIWLFSISIFKEEAMRVVTAYREDGIWATSAQEPFLFLLLLACVGKCISILCCHTWSLGPRWLWAQQLSWVLIAPGLAYVATSVFSPTPTTWVCAQGETFKRALWVLAPWAPMLAFAVDPDSGRSAYLSRFFPKKAPVLEALAIEFVFPAYFVVLACMGHPEHLWMALVATFAPLWIAIGYASWHVFEEWAREHPVWRQLFAFALGGSARFGGLRAIYRCDGTDFVRAMKNTPRTRNKKNSSPFSNRKVTS